jgi:type VI secretion system secreted protein VgrG
MPAYTQTNLLLKVTTPLGKDRLLLVALQGHEAISELFHFRLDLLAERSAPVPFDRVLGQSATVELALPGGRKRFFNGIIQRLTQGRRDEHFVHFRAELVPQFWLWTRRVQCRIFQHVGVPDILKQVLTGLNVKFEFQGSYHPRDYCVQYRESDFAFASRLMEEEGIYYFFKHADGSHQLIVTDAAARHPDLEPSASVIFEEVIGGLRPEDRVTDWEKSQELRSGQYTLWDHCFEMPGKNLEARQRTLESVAVGTVTHKLKLGATEPLEIYDYPGGYAQRFDGVDKGGAPKPAELEKIHTDNQRTARIRMEQEALPGLEVRGQGSCRHFTAGFQFRLTRHFDADGPYLLTRVEHSARQPGAYRSGGDAAFSYENRFTCIPAALPYRPPLATPRPTVSGTQTATVVGPPGEEIFCDKYGRVKVQFHWDRHGKKDAGSSCWVRVAQAWAGGGFGAICIPRVGQEVVVDFLEGDPDQPLVLGSVYNAAQMPPFTLPDHRMFSGIKTNSVRGHPAKNFSGLAFNDKTGGEHTALYAEKDLMINAENNHKHHVGVFQHAKVGRTSLGVVGGIPGIGGGGSGGGGGGATGTTTEGDVVKDGQITQIGSPPPPPSRSYTQWQTSDGKLAANLGFAGATVYGVNQQDTCGFMHQVTIGQATQIVVDPVSCWGYLPSTGGSMAFWPSEFISLGGNQQLYWGTNYQSTYGPNVNLTYAPQMDITTKPSKLTAVMGKLLPALNVVYEVVYAGIGIESDIAADIAAASFAVLVVAGIGVLVASQKADKLKKLVEDTANAGKETTAVAATLGLAMSSLASAVPKTLINHVAATKQLALNLAPKGQQLSDADQAHSVVFVDGVLLQAANHIHQIARADPTADGPPPEPSTFVINSAGDGTNGTAFINATKGLAITSGGALIELDNKQNTSGDVTVHCGMQGTIMLFNLPICGPGAQLIQLDKTSISLTAGALVSATLDQKSITLVAGPNKITMDPTGVTIDALNITLKAKIKIGKKAQLHTVEATMSDHNFSFHTIK